MNEDHTNKRTLTKLFNSLLSTAYWRNDYLQVADPWLHERACALADLALDALTEAQAAAVFAAFTREFPDVLDWPAARRRGIPLVYPSSEEV